MATDKPIPKDGIELLVDAGLLCDQVCDGVLDRARAGSLRDSIDDYLAKLGDLRSYIERRQEARVDAQQAPEASLEETIDRAVKARERAERDGVAVPR